MSTNLHNCDTNTFDNQVNDPDHSILSLPFHDKHRFLKTKLVDHIINSTINPAPKPKTTKSDSAPVRISLPYTGKTSHHISRILKQQAGIDTYFTPATPIKPSSGQMEVQLSKQDASASHLTLSPTTMLSHSVLVAVIFFSLTAHHTEGLANEETTAEKDVQDVKCPHLPCPFPGNCTHKVWSHFWYHGKLCKGCQYCVNATSTNMSADEDVKCPRLPCPPPPRPNCTRTAWSFFWYQGKLCKGCQYCVISHGPDPRDSLSEDVKCPHLPCPFPGNCTHKVWSHFWYHGKLCKGCQYCVNATSTNMSADEDVKCPHLPCPFPGNCTHKVWSHFWYHGKLCKGCQYCVNVTGTASDDAVTDTGPTCPHLPCPPPFPNCARFEWTHFKYEGKVCKGCQMCVYWNISKVATRQIHHQCPMFKCLAPGPCDRPYSVHQVTMQGVPHTCPGCPYCPSEPSDLKGLLASCPDVSCVEPGPCNVPLKTQILRVGHRDCSGCTYCPQ
ncbi:uncharacterized protein [Haliotis asinina]|uniref:uncharacterized protein n=1 Tax=Haliotis asinina TaxID=109174 RepID=UPI003531A6F0